MRGFGLKKDLRKLLLLLLEVLLLHSRG